MKIENNGKELRLTMTRGDSETFIVNVKNYELTDGDIIEFTARKNINADKAIYKRVTEFEDNKAIIELRPEDTKDLAFAEYRFDVQLTYASGRVATIVKDAILKIGVEYTYD